MLAKDRLRRTDGGLDSLNRLRCLVQFLDAFLFSIQFFLPRRFSLWLGERRLRTLLCESRSAVVQPSRTIVVRAAPGASGAILKPFFL